MITADDALDLVVRTAVSLAPQSYPLEKACGLTLAEDVVAEDDYPSFPRAMMDGFAVRLADAGKDVPVAGEVPAGTSWEGELVDGRCLAILTGAPCPPGTEAVVPKEHVRQHEHGAALPVEITAGQNIATAGSECRPGERVLAAGMRLTPLAVGALAAFGWGSVRVIPRPRLAVITTGGELAGKGQPLQPGQIRDVNGPMLAAMAEDLGVGPPRRLHAVDRPDEIRCALEQSADADIVVLTGGVSVGTYDCVPQALAGIGAETIFHGVKQKPGKPLLFARTGRSLYFGLPGNPLACHLGFHRYVSAAIRKMSGCAPRRYFQGELAGPVESKGGRTHFVPGRAEPAGDSRSPWRLAPLSGASSADVFRTAGANCYLEVPPLGRTMRAGETCPFTWLSGRE
jgi:molybdopterin molybdotransferase